MTINRNFLKVMWVIVITVLQFMRAIISLKKRGATLMLSFSSCEAKKGSRDLDFSDMKKLRTYFKMGTFLATFEQFSVQFCKKRCMNTSRTTVCYVLWLISRIFCTTEKTLRLQVRKNIFRLMNMLCERKKQLADLWKNILRC